MEALKIYSNSRIKWVWYVFGDDMLTVNITKDVSWYRRLKTRFFLGSRWERK